MVLISTCQVLMRNSSSNPAEGTGDDGKAVEGDKPPKADAPAEKKPVVAGASALGDTPRQQATVLFGAGVAGLLGGLLGLGGGTIIGKSGRGRCITNNNRPPDRPDKLLCAKFDAAMWQHHKHSSHARMSKRLSCPASVTVLDSSLSPMGSHI
jgi:hypothetical protein